MIESVSLHCLINYQMRRLMRQTDTRTQPFIVKDIFNLKGSLSIQEYFHSISLSTISKIYLNCLKPPTK